MRREPQPGGLRFCRPLALIDKTSGQRRRRDLESRRPLSPRPSGRTVDTVGEGAALLSRRDGDSLDRT